MRHVKHFGRFALFVILMAMAALAWAQEARSIYDFSLTDAEGKEVHLKDFKGFGQGKMAGLLDNMLKKQDPDYASKPDIKWNFTKFLIDREGNVVARFEPTADMAEVEAHVAALL